jgi:hypothetical protein
LGQNIVIQEDFLVTYENNSEIMQAIGLEFDPLYHKTSCSKLSNTIQLDAHHKLSDNQKIVPNYIEPGICNEGFKVINKTKYPAFFKISEEKNNFNVNAIKITPGEFHVWNINEIKHLAWCMSEQFETHSPYLVFPGKIYQICVDMHVREGNGEIMQHCYCYSFDSPFEFGPGHFHSYEEIIKEDFYEKHLHLFPKYD